MGFFLELYTTEQIGTSVYANSFIDLLEKYGLQLNKIGLHEPIKAAFSKNKLVEFWTIEEDGCYNIETNQMEGKAGSVMGKGEGFWFQTYWWKQQNKVKLNFITIYFAKKLFKNSEYGKYELLFKDLMSSFNALYGYLGDEVSVKRQHTTGNIEDRISGVFWCNYYNRSLKEYLNSQNKINSFSWYRIEEMSSGGTFTMLTEKPVDNEIEKKENEAQEYFGKEKFNGNAQDYPILLNISPL